MIKILIDNSPLRSGHAHRGIGVYTRNLIEALEKNKNHYPDIQIYTEGNISDFDIVHYPYFDLFYNTLPLRKPAKTIVTIHDVTPLVLPEGYPPGLRGKLRLMIQKYSLKNISMIMTDSHASKKDIERYLGVNESIIKVVYLAPSDIFRRISNEIVLSEVKEKYKLPNKFVLYTGGINYNKNIPALVRACNKIGIPLVIVGKQAVETNIDRDHPENRDLNWLQNYYRHPARNATPVAKVVLSSSHSVAGGLILTGFVPEEDLPAIYSQATVYCQPSLYEGFGIPVLEAMSCGCPVVATNRGSLPEVGGGAVLVVESTEYNEIAKALAKVLGSDKIQSDLREKGYVQAKKFYWGKTAREVLAAYKSLIQNNEK